MNNRLPGNSAKTDAFITRYLPLVDAVVGGMIGGLPSSFERDDLVQAGRVGLVIAARLWSKGLPKHWKNRTPAAEKAAVRQMIKRQIYHDAAVGTWDWATRRADGDITLTEPCEPSRFQAAERAYEQAKLPRCPEGDPDYSTLRTAIEEAKSGLTKQQKELLDLVFEHSISVREIGRKKLIGVGWRRTRQMYQDALEVVGAKLGEMGWAA